MFMTLHSMLESLKIATEPLLSMSGHYYMQAAYQRIYGLRLLGMLNWTTMKAVMNRLHVWHLKMRFCDQAHTDSEHVTDLEA